MSHPLEADMNAMHKPASTIRSNFKPSAAGVRQRDLLPIWTAAAAFLIDIKTPNGVIDGFLYVLAVLTCVWVPRVHYAPCMALGLTLPMILGLELSPGDGSIRAAITNRLVGLLAVWLAAFVVWRNARATANRESVINELHRRVTAAERVSRGERIELATWLKREVGRELEIADWQLSHLPRCVRRSSEVRGEAVVLRRVIARAQQSVRGKTIQLHHAGAEPGPVNAQISTVGLRTHSGNKVVWDDFEPMVDL
jgi:hypothetical protein